MRWFQHKIMNMRKAKKVTKNKGKDVVELNFEEDRPKTIKKVIEIISTKEQEPSVLNSKQTQQDQRPVRATRSVHKLWARNMAATSDTTQRKSKKKQDQQVP